MKVLEIDYYYYYYPQGICCIEDFLAYVKENYHSFIKLTYFDTDNCVFPYFISEDTKEIYLNVASIAKISEAEVTVLTRAEYDARLAEVVKEKCVGCVHYEEDSEGDNLKGHREKITLDGECWGYEKKE